MNLDPIYSDLIKHLLREDKLPTLENVCAKVQKEQGSHSLFGHKEPLITANKGIYTPDDKKAWVCDYCKKDGHTKDKCWTLHPHLVPPYIRAPTTFKSNNGNKWRKPRAHLAQEVMVDQNKAGPSQSKHEGAAHTSASSQLELVKKPLSTSQLNPADLEAIINALRESGNSGYTFNASSSLKPLIVDSGASHHMISDSKLISNIKPVLGNVVIANGEQVPIRGIGSLKLFNKDPKAFYLPSFTSNLLSVKQATTDLNCHAIFSPNGVCFQDIETHKVLGKGVTKDDLYVLEDLSLNSSLSCASVFNDSVFKGECFKSDSSTKNECVYVSNEFRGDLWHARLGHPHFRALGLIFPKISFKNDECEACILGKHCKSVFPKSNTVYEHCFELIHSDVWTSPYESREHHKYFVTFIDEKSKYTWVTLLPSKDRVLEAFINFHAYVSNHYNAKIKCFRSDNGGEYTSHAFKEQLIKHGITHQTSCPYTPQQNGVAERKNRHLMEVARSMMFHMNVPKKFWSDALVSACYLINRIPTKILQDNSPFEVLNKTKPMLNHLRVFGCVCFVLVPGDHRNKLEAKSTKAMLIGYSTTQKGYKCYVPETRRVLVSRDVRFMETKAFYEERNWEAIKDLSSTSSDRAESLRRILENIGISQPVINPSSQQETKEDTLEATITADEGLPVDQPSHLEHEGG